MLKWSYHDMQVIADLHLHSKYSRAVSQSMILQTMAQYGLEKGLQLLTASDWTHPVWLKEISALLEEADDGVFRLKSGTEQTRSVRFVLSTEISSIYKQGEKIRRIHNLVFVSSLAKADEFSKALAKKGANIAADGRPIVGLSSREVLELLLSTDAKGMLIPCHVWTPHFGLYGSSSGFDSLSEAFGDLSEYIYGIETGLSSDPEMNWQMPELVNRSILSFSDAHSPAKIGREATVFTRKDGIFSNGFSSSYSEFSYEDLRETIMGKSEQWRIGYTIEFYPEEGKYHFSGHRNCKIRYTPLELKEKGNICPVCKKQFTEGVFVRLSSLVGRDDFESAVIKQTESGLRWFTDPHKQHPPYVKLVPLLEIIAESLESTVTSQKVKDLYRRAVRSFGSELNILLKTPIPTLASLLHPKVAEGIAKVRRGDIIIEPGYDGEYGVVKIWPEHKDVAKNADENVSQMSLDF